MIATAPPTLPLSKTEPGVPDQNWPTYSKHVSRCVLQRSAAGDDDDAPVLGKSEPGVPDQNWPTYSKHVSRCALQRCGF
ncbi:hypothetical protein Tdes44962_MAKER03332 [Teratosphaeria destructans]|uniref:Uncharacterized protein n=1 Tax=Teratosphaeria destructans TaxID=418781 RepID=A0A9W7SQG7_9PEZI|nr:hypothetical protein Tdes44962_MAKER03332 [Teratosphaeria destructans]